MRSYIYLILVVLFSNNVILQASTVKTLKMNVEKWEVVTLEFSTSELINNPFQIEILGHFKHENGDSLIVPGFYNGNNTWAIRFSSGEIGNWTYETSSSISQLNHKKGAIYVHDKSSKNHHGTIVIDPKNSNYFMYEDGTPYFLMAFECDWIYALDYKNNQGIPKTEHLLNVVKENGFNQVVTTVYSYDVDWEKSPQYWPKDPLLKENSEHEFGAPKDIFPFLGTNENPDFSELNIEYFQKLDRVVAAMHDKNIVAHLMIYVWNKLVSWPKPNSIEDNLYFDYVVKRYQAYPNILWDISKEAMLYGTVDEAFFLNKIERLKKIDVFNRLVTVHDFGFCKRNADKVDFISKQDWSYDLYTKMLTTSKEFNNKPIFNIEHGGYEEAPYEVFTGFYTNAETCLDRNYQCAFTGAYSTYYWQAASWDVIIHNPFEQPKEFKKPKFEYFKHMTDFFQKNKFSSFSPFPAKNMSGYCMKGQNDTYLYYLPKDSYRVFGGWLFNETKQTRKIQWFNTLSGMYSEEKIVTNKDVITSPWYGKAPSILIIK